MTAFVTYSQLADDITTLAGELRGKINGVVGIERSGMVPAHMLAMELNLPVVGFNEFIRYRFDRAVSGQRLQVEPPRNGWVAVIDDSVNSGWQMADVQSRWRDNIICDWSPYYVTAYWSGTTPAHGHDLHFYGRILPKPRFFEWNIWHHVDLKDAMLDMDGILCRDPEVFDDDGSLYERAIANALPLHLPSRRIGAVCTSRIERWRGITEKWLADHGVVYDELRMGKWETAEDRRESMAHGFYKGIEYRDSPYSLFIESSSEQSRDIARYSGGKPVLDWHRKEMV
jgi:orotate phosphoribosyltransferase